MRYISHVLILSVTRPDEVLFTCTILSVTHPDEVHFTCTILSVTDPDEVLFTCTILSVTYPDEVHFTCTILSVTDPDEVLFTCTILSVTYPDEVHFTCTILSVTHPDEVLFTCTILSVTDPDEVHFYSVLEHIKTTGTHAISRWFIPYIYGSLGEWILQTSNLLCSFTSCPLVLSKLDMLPLVAASRSRLLETEPKLCVFETSYYAFCGRYCFESVASKIK